MFSFSSYSALTSFKSELMFVDTVVVVDETEFAEGKEELGGDESKFGHFLDSEMSYHELFFKKVRIE